MIIVKRSRLIQPQASYQIARIPLTVGMTGLWLPSLSTDFSARNLVTGISQSPLGQTGQQLAIGAQGPAWSVSSSGSGRFVQLANMEELFSSASTGSFGIWKQKTDTTQRIALTFCDVSNPFNLGAFAPYSDGTLYFEGWGSELAISGLTYGQDRLLFTGGQAGKRVYKNGSLVGSNAGTGSVTLTGRVAGISSDAENNNDYANVFIVAAWNRQLSDSEARAWTRNPWQVFAPRQIVIPTITAAPSLPTLSAATYVPGSITATGFRPRVTAS